MTKTGRAGLLPLAITIMGVALLLALGTWQLQRLAGKNALLERIEARMTSPAVPLPAGAVDPVGWEYRKVNVSGTFLHAHEIHLFTIGADGRPGYQVITPLVRDNALPVLVDRGWVPETLKRPATRPAGQPAGQVDIEGQISAPRRKARFTPENDLPGNVWYYVDLEEMALATGLGDHMPVMVAARAPANSGTTPGGYPRTSQAVRLPPNNHLMYTITWYFLAFGLAGVFLVYRSQQKA